MTYSDWREELILIEGAKSKIIIKGLRKLGIIKKPKITKPSGMRPDIDPDLFAQFPGINYRKLIDPNYKANRNPKLAKAIKIFKDKLERAKMPSSSPYSTYVAPKVEIRSPIPPKLSQQIKSNLSKITKKIKDKKKKIGEEVMAAPTNNVGGGQIAGTVEAGDDPPKKKKKKKKKTYAYGGRGSRKMWMNNK